VRTSFWFTMAAATTGLAVALVLASPLAHLLQLGDSPNLVRAAAVGLWAQMNYEQLTSLFRVEQRPVAFVIGSLTNIAITIATTIVLVAVAHEGPVGVLIGNFTGTLVVYLALLAYRREQLGLGFDRGLLRAMNRFGVPLVPAALALWGIGFVDRFFVAVYHGQAEVGRYSLAVRASSAIVLLMTAFRTAWPAFAYSIEDDREARSTYGYVLTYLVYVCCWLSLALGLLSPWLVRVLAPTREGFWPASRSVGLLCLANSAYAAYTVVAIGIGRARRTQFNWVVTGSAAVLNVALNFALIPRYGQLGAAISTLASYGAMFVFMSWHAQRIYRVPYQWRRVGTLAAAAGALLALGKGLEVSLAWAAVLSGAFPLVLLALGFYLPAERARLRRLVPILR
jgi:O-antigen/teichoic acid export membrane protein